MDTELLVRRARGRFARRTGGDDGRNRRDLDVAGGRLARRTGGGDGRSALSRMASLAQRRGSSAAAESFVRETLEGVGIEMGGDGPADIKVHDPRAYLRILCDRELGLGETYQQGWWDANQLDEFLSVVLEADLRSLVRPGAAVIGLIVRREASEPSVGAAIPKQCFSSLRPLAMTCIHECLTRT